MKKVIKVLTAGCICMMMSGTFTAHASMNLDTEASVAGISVALNNFYAKSREPEKKLAEKLEQQAASRQAVQAVQAVSETQPETEAPKPKASPYENVAVSQVSDYVNIRSEANTTSDIQGKIYNNCAADILETMSGEDGTWYKIKSGNVTGYIKAEYFATGAEAEKIAKDVGTQYAEINTTTLRLRAEPNTTSETLTLLAQGAKYTVLEEKDGFAKLAIDTDMVGYVSTDYINTTVEFDQAVSVEEEAAKKAEEAKRKKEAEEAMKRLQELQKAEEERKKAESLAAETAASEPETVPELTVPETTEAETEAPETSPSENVPGTIEANPEGNGGGPSVEAPTTAPETTAPETAKTPETTVQSPETTVSEPENEGPGAAGPGAAGPGGGSGVDVTSATRTAIVAYAKQFLGNPYVYGGTSLTKGADCSGFTMKIFENFGINTGRTSRDQAAKGKTISVNAVQPGDLLFYSSGNVINHVALYIGGGQVIHSSTPKSGIVIALGKLQNAV